MDPTMPAEQARVRQEDREAAVDLAHALDMPAGEFTAQSVLLVQAFARHREAAYRAALEDAAGVAQRVTCEIAVRYGDYPLGEQLSGIATAIRALGASEGGER